jgi:hypothetical protein
MKYWQPVAVRTLVAERQSYARWRPGHVAFSEWKQPSYGNRAVTPRRPMSERSTRAEMGVKNYLIEGVSGTGKTAVCTELQRRGYQAIHGDRELVYRGDPETGLPTAPETGLPTAPETGTPTATWMSEHQIWDVEKVQAFVANQEAAVTFFCGGSRNFAKFIDLFDSVFVLDVDLDTMNRRIDERVALDPTDFGGKPEERELAVRLHQTKEDIPKNGIIIDATAPLARVVDEILSKCREADQGAHS